ncbi:IS1380 family transposase [Amycolatopsis acidiphila]|uniref:IS1380 family transposase n=2 Tax=Amycolatopsis TaxID=1813 RepID=A0A558A7P8_9PSEU|nr:MULTISPECIES: IS1380 family transposase [Amycolatopsis]PKV92512.1 DDE family transposase [Amycolatopsis niigatensis]TVT20287.1 IS1380 family transposase [Amycolatopsis acidiphila]UIJ59702.1 IS1380 family transposase [Amycolatopsis acidiphila]GHG81462.1 IS1380 family transposase [Amycolatopsis acidiphila]
MQVSHRFAEESAIFDDDHLVSLAGLVPVMTLAGQTRLPQLLAEKVSITQPRIASGTANPGPKLATVIAGMCAGADCIDDVDVVRSGGMTTLFGGVYAPSTVGTLLREFTFGHARQLESVLREHLTALCERVDLLPGTHKRVFVDIDSLLRPVYGHAKQGASYGHTKIAGKQVLRKGLSPLATTLSTEHGAPVIAGMRLRAGKTGSGKGAGRMVAQAIGTARAAGAGDILVRGDSAYGSRSVVRACRRAGARFSLVLTKNAAVRRVIAAIGEDAWTPVKYPGAVRDPDTGEWISDAEVAEIPYTAFASTADRVTARLIVRRVKDARYPDALFPVWRYHPFFTNTAEPTAAADITHRRHAVIETVFADLIDGPLAHLPSGRFGANSAWVLCAAIAHNLLRACGVLAGDRHGHARGATLRRRIVTVPARFARPQRRPVLHLPRHWPGATSWLRLWRSTIGFTPPSAMPI